MFIDLSGVRSVRWSHAADRKNVLGPILALPLPSAFCEPEKCSRTYPESARLVGHTLHTGRMFQDYLGFLLALGPMLFTKRTEWGRVALIAGRRKLRNGFIERTCLPEPDLGLPRTTVLRFVRLCGQVDYFRLRHPVQRPPRLEL